MRVHKMRGIKIDCRYTWRKEWISPYESLWGIFEKFKFANCATVKDIYELFGTDYVKNLKSYTIGRPHRDCINPSGLNDDLMEPVFLKPLIQINAQNINLIIGILPNHPFNRSSYVRDELFFCPECIKTGFHSLFHQFKLLHECPYHRIRLHQGCLKCNQPIPFELTDQYTKEPFRCKCGHSFLDHKEEKCYSLNWKPVSLCEIKLEKVNTWINLDDNLIARLKSFHFPLNLDMEECKGLFDYILFVLNQKYPDTSQSKHQVVNSASNIRQLFSSEEKKERKLSDSLKLTKLFDVIYQSSVQTVQSIASHLRKTYLRNHKFCLQRLMKSSFTTEPICPYALAYGHWLKFILDYESIWTMRRAYHFREYPGRIEFGSKQDDAYLSDLFHSLQFSVQDFTEESRAAIKWIFNRVMGHLIWNHFINWLSIAQEAAENRLEYRRMQFEQKTIPFYILVIPENKNESIEFHWWDKSLQNHIKLKCPFSSE